MAFRVCEHWFAGLFTGRPVPPRAAARAAQRGPTRWAALCRALNAMPGAAAGPARAVSRPRSRGSRADARRQPAVPPAVAAGARARLPRGPAQRRPLRAIGRAPTAKPEIAFVGRVTPYKGLDDAVEALALLRDAHGVHGAAGRRSGRQDADHDAEVRALAARRVRVAEPIDWLGAQDDRRGGRRACAGARGDRAVGVGRAAGARADRGRLRARAGGRRRRRRASARRCAPTSTRCSLPARRRSGGRRRGPAAHADARPRRPRRACAGARAGRRLPAASSPTWRSRRASCRDAHERLRGG